jgi:Spy/CpxP family protein refolding chaperone
MKHLPKIALALLCTVSLALAGPGRGNQEDEERGPRMEQMGPDMDGPGQGDGRLPPGLSELNLTDAQKAKLKEHHDKNEEAFIDMRAGKQKAELRLRQALEAQPIDETKLKSAREDLVKYQTQQIDFRITQMRFFLSVLTPEQRKKFDSAMADHEMDGMGKGKHKNKDGKGKDNKPK